MKKVLSMMLSAALVVSLIPMTVWASGTETADHTVGSMVLETVSFRDVDQIQNREAVDVLTALNVISGMEDGTFRPQGNLTRAQTAKLIYTLVGQGTQQDNIDLSDCYFSDVSSDHWAAEMIAYGASKGYLNGMGDGTFHPEGQVAASHLAAILDKLLGYRAEDVSAKWPESAMSYAVESGLFIGIGKKADESLNREEAAQMIFNALKADMKELPDSQSTGQLPRCYVAVKTDIPVDYQLRDNNRYLELIETLFPDVVYRPNQKDPFGRNIDVWRKSAHTIRIEQTEKPAFVYTHKKTGYDLQNDLRGYDFQNADIYLNGERIPASAGYICSPADVAEVLTGNGILVEIYADQDDRKITKIITAFYELKEVSGADSEKQTLTVNTGSSEVVLTKEDECFSAVSSAVKGDQILAAPSYHFLSYDGGCALETDWSRVIDAYRPEELNGTISAIKTSTAEGMDDGMAVIGDRVCRQAAGYQMSSLAEDENETGTAYLDRYGFLKGFIRESESAKAAEWILVKAVYWGQAASASSGSWYLRGVTQSGEIRDLKIHDAGYLSRESGTSGQAVTETVSRVKSTYDLLNPYIQAIEAGESSAEDAEILLTSDSVFLKHGRAAAYYESAAGCYLCEEDRTQSGELLGNSILTENDYSENVQRIKRIKIADDVKMVIVGGIGTDTLSVSTSDGLSRVPAGAVCIIKSTRSGNRRIVTVFTEHEAYQADTKEALIRVTGSSGMTVYEDSTGELHNDGIVVTYYDSDSAAEKTMIVARPNSGTIKSGWYTQRIPDGEASILGGYVSDAGSVKRDNTKKSVTGGFYSGAVVSAYQDMITVKGDTEDLVYQLSGDEAVRDLSGKGIATVNRLSEAVGDGEAGSRVAFAYVVRNGSNIITQLYILG